MTLEIIWRNPASPPVTEPRVEQIAADDLGAVYAVRSADQTTVFELIPRDAAYPLRILKQTAEVRRERIHGD
jgi:hypothetical protein